MKNFNLNFLQSLKKYSSPKMGIVFILIIILQFGLFPVISSALRFGSDYNRYVDYLYFYIMSSYTVIVLGIVILDVSGLRLITDHFSLWLIVLSCFFRLGLGGDHVLFYRIYLGLLGLVLSAYILANRRRFALPTLKLVIAGMLWSVGTVTLIASLQALLDPTLSVSLPQNLASVIVNSIAFDMSFGTVIEEACFRGLLVGFIVMNGYNENSAFFVQAILFWALHYVNISDPVLFFVQIPLLSLSTTLIMKKYKMLFLPIMTHTVVNVFTYVLAVVLKQYLM